MTHSRMPHPFKLKRLAQAATLLIASGVSLQAQAQEAKLERVDVTGTSIKRIEGETALPVQTLKRADIDKTGATTAAEIMRSISGNTAGLTDGASITDSTGGQRGFNGANLRGIGVSSTLILLNGRRMANFASPGDNSGVDLNNIPAGAIERVEILKDGASAIYGTDAIGGVINFITRKDYRGADINVYASRTQEGGAEKTAASVGGGFGDLAKDKFNVFGVIDVQKLGSLRSTEREFLQDRPLATTLPFYMSSRTFPGNIRLASKSAPRKVQLDALNAAGFTFNGKPFTQRTINLYAPACNPPATVYAKDNLSEACSFDYMQDTELYPESDKAAFLGRGVFQLNNETQLFAEVLKSKTKTLYVASPNPIEITGVPTAAINPFLPKPLPFGGNVDVRQRVSEGGNRSNEVTSDAERIVAGVSGSLGTWDYDVALNRAVNKTDDALKDGYFLYDKFVAGVRAGQINPFGKSPQAGQDLLAGIKVQDTARSSKGTTTTVDAKFSGELMQLGGGALGAAFGAEFRREETEFNPSALLLTNNIQGDRSSRGDSPPASKNSRNVAAVYGELNAPFTKELEVQLAARFDDYSGVGNTFNPKLGARWQPSKQLMLRGSAGTGFRAPSINELTRPTSFGSSSAFLTDPGCVSQGFSVADCTDQWRVERRSNDKLKPEKSKQFSLGLVLEPVRDLSASIDYWMINKTDVISDLSEQVILGNLPKYEKGYVKRDEFGEFIDTILLKKENQGELRTSGIDLDVSYRFNAGEAGRFRANANGTYVLKYERQFGAGEPFESNAGRFLSDQVIQKWRHRVSVDWDIGAFGLTLGNTYYSGYTDHNTAFNPNTSQLLPARDVQAYSLWDMSGSWAINKAAKLRVGVQNLLDKQPPFSNQGYYFLATYDPTYTDPRGRNFYASLSYSFR
ncbi:MULTISPECIES: TonB-dependent receptor [Roseateles]|uniref:TonB-dependent receptor n=1 Tax=Roseateles albus TaxID=2987525 RepID=A0ABT5KBI1_9BURK|nr:MULTISPECIES: TonB-dependent receptor [Roseateles]MCV2358834.1 TonB-dependent receptor [Paucibacter sp. TC2R-5]MDC8771294.1 TonB-dependent receptor [Roseateles albus]